MANKYTPVTFNAGAPLDPQKLMDLQSNITSLVTDVNGLTNATLDQQYTLKIDGGSYVTGKLTAGSADTEQVVTSASFSGVPFIIASVGSSLAKDEVVTVSITSAGVAPSIRVISNKNREPVRINWIAFEKNQ
jgi:hypothetical protein